MAGDFFYQIVVNAKTRGNCLFTYKSEIKLPERIIVKVDFSGRKILGFVFKKITHPYFPIKKIKKIEKVVDFSQLLDEKRVQLAKIAADYYLTSFGKMIFWALPQIALRSVLKKSQKQSKTRKKNLKYLKPIFYQANSFKRLEFYQKLIRQEIKNKKQVLFLAPNLNHWLVKDLIKSFSPAVFSSNLSRKKEYLLWRKVLKEGTNLVIGSQKAIFSPLKHLSLIIVEDAGNPNYKQEQDPRVDTRFLAKNLAKICGAKIVFSGLIPDPQTYLEIKKKKFIFKKDFQKPKIALVDLFKQNKLVGFETEEEIKKMLKKRKKIIFFYNRLGFAQLTLCQDCGFYDFQKRKTGLSFCPQCKSLRIRNHSYGLERLAFDLQKIFPRTKIALLFKSSEDKLSGLNIASSFALKLKEKFDLSVLGLAEIGLSLPDPYISYKVLHFGFEALSLAQKGIIQTFIPEHFLIKSLCHLDFEIFYKNWLNLRNKFKLGPSFKEIKLFNLPLRTNLEKFLKKLRTFKELSAVYQLANLKENYFLLTLPRDRKISHKLKKFLEKSPLKIDVDPAD